MLDYVALLFWLAFVLPNTLRLKKKKVIKIGDFLLLTTLGLVGSEFLWLYILHNYIYLD